MKTYILQELNEANAARIDTLLHMLSPDAPALGPARLAKLLAKLIDKLPQLLRIFAVLNIGLYTSSHKRGTDRLYLVFYKYFHCSKIKRFC